jgi:hypothetical protein
MLKKKRRMMVKSMMYAKSRLCVPAISNSRSILKGVAICIKGMRAIYYLKIKMSVLFFLMINLFLFGGTIFTTATAFGCCPFFFGVSIRVFPKG